MNESIEFYCFESWNQEEMSFMFEIIDFYFGGYVHSLCEEKFHGWSKNRMSEFHHLNFKQLFSGKKKHSQPLVYHFIYDEFSET